MSHTRVLYGGLQIADPPTTRFERPGAAEQMEDTLRNLRRDVTVARLIRDIPRVRSRVATSEAAELGRVFTLLRRGPEHATDELIEVTSRFVGEKLRLVPLQRRSLELPAVSTRAAGGRTVRFKASTRDLDRHGTRIDPMGLDLENFRKNPVFIWHHSYAGFGATPKVENVLGKVTRLSRDASGLDIDAEFAPAEVNPAAETALKLVRGGFLSACSIGFIPRRIEIEMEGGDEIPVIREAELLEVSLVMVGSNPNALVSDPSRSGVGAVA